VKNSFYACLTAEGVGQDIVVRRHFFGNRTMSKHRIKFKLPFFGEAEAEGLAGIVALVIVVVVAAVVVLHWPS
jgi:hypothetical protein